MVALLMVLLTPAALVQPAEGGVRLDWTRGQLEAPGVGAPDLRAPNLQVARVGAERAARKLAERRLDRVVRALGWAEGGTIGQRAEADAKLDARLRRALGRTRDLEVRYSSDGSVELRVAVPLEAIRQAIDPPGDPPRADAQAPTAILVDVSRLALHPTLGLVLGGGTARYRGPAIYVPASKDRPADPRLGDKPVETRATGITDGVIAVELPEADLVAAARSGALVVFVGARR